MISVSLLILDAIVNISRTIPKVQISFVPEACSQKIFLRIQWNFTNIMTERVTVLFYQTN